MSQVVPKEVIWIIDAVHSIGDAISWVSADGKPAESNDLLWRLSSTIKFLDEYIRMWRTNGAAHSHSEVSGLDATLSSKIVSLFISSVPENTSDPEFCSNSPGYNWYEDHERNADYFSRLLGKLLDSVKKLAFSQNVIAQASLMGLEGCIGARFEEMYLPLKGNSVDMTELKIFMHTFANRLTVVINSIRQ